SWEWLGFALPEATFRVRCSAGTYVRTLAHDLGAALGTGAALCSLRRTRSEPFSVERTVTLEDLDRLPASEVIAMAGIPIDEALAVLPAVVLDEAAARAIGAGARPAVAAADAAPLGAGPRSVVFRDGTGRSLALGELAADPARPGGALACPHVVFP